MGGVGLVGGMGSHSDYKTKSQFSIDLALNWPTGTELGNNVKPNSILHHRRHIAVTP